MFPNASFHCQQLLTGCFAMPECKPDIEQVLNVVVKPIITDIHSIPGKLIFDGYIEIDVEYVGDVPDCTQTVHFTSFHKSFCGFIDCPHMQPCLKSCLGVTVEYDEFIPTCCRYLDFTIVIDVYLM